LEIHESGPIKIHIPVKSISGTLTIGPDPLAASLAFRNRAAASVTIHSDSSGRFAGFLPVPPPAAQAPAQAILYRDGDTTTDWLVHIEAEQPFVRRQLRVKIPPEQPKTTLELSLQDSRIEAVVMDEDGHAAADAIITVRLDQELFRFVLPEPGRFELRGLPSGKLRIEAEANAAATDAVTISLPEPPAKVSVKLILKSTVPLMTTVLVDGVPIPGAKVLVEPMDLVGGPALQFAVQTTDTRGQFVTRIPAASRQVGVVATAPGFAIHVSSVQLSQNGSLTVSLKRSGGAVTIALPEGGLERDGPVPLLFHQGYWVSLPYLIGMRRASVEDRRVSVGLLEPGEYAVCLRRPAEVRAETVASIQPGSACRSVQVSLGGEEATVQLDALRR
jgi:hypothetical protein